MGDIGARIEDSQNWFERAARRVPGYKGYKEKELRREADKLQREYVADRLETARRKLEDLNLALVNRGDVKLLGVVDSTGRRLRTVKDRISYADYGYAGWFDTVKVDENILDQLYMFDVRLQDEAAGIEKLIAVLSPDSPSLRSDLDLVGARVQALDESFSQREYIVTGQGGSPGYVPPAPEATPPAPPAPDAVPPGPTFAAQPEPGAPVDPSQESGDGLV
jgi:hypothetical protein